MTNPDLSRPAVPPGTSLDLAQLLAEQGVDEARHAPYSGLSSFAGNPVRAGVERAFSGVLPAGRAPTEAEEG